MKLVTEDKFKFGQKNIVPHLGLIEISHEGVVEVEEGKEELAKALIELETGFFEHNDEVDSIVDDSSNLDETEKEKEEDLKKKAEDDDLGDKGEESNLEPQVEEDTIGSVLNEVPAEPEEEEEKEEVSGISEEEKQKILESLEEKTFAEIREFTASMGFPEEEWTQKVNGPQLKKYLSEKIIAL